MAEPVRPVALVFDRSYVGPAPVSLADIALEGRKPTVYSPVDASPWLSATS